MGLTVDNLLGALAVCSGKTVDDPAEIVDLVRRAEPSLAATLFSAWQAENDDLNPALRYEVQAVRGRIEYYRSIAARMRAEVPGLTTIKGLEVADLYPDGLVRNMSDLDIIAPSESGQWRVVSLLIQDGWEIDTATFSQLQGTLRVMVSMRRSHEDRYQLPYGIETATYYTLGNQAGIPPILSLPAQWRVPAIKNTIMLLHERYEQPFRARDLVDAALLHRSLRGSELDALHRAVIKLGLAVEYSELVRLVHRAGLGPMPSLSGGEWTAARVRALRLARSTRHFARPLAGTGRQLQRRLMEGKLRPAEHVAWGAVQRWLPATPAVRAGLLAFGLPLDVPPPQVTAAVLHSRGALTWADTPVARFLLTIGDEVEQSAVDELSGSDEPGRGAESPPATKAAAETSR